MTVILQTQRATFTVEDVTEVQVLEERLWLMRRSDHRVWHLCDLLRVTIKA